MKLAYIFIILIVHTALYASTGIKEQFSNLNNWTHLKFQKIETPSVYVIDSSEQILVLSSQNGASALIHSRTFDINRNSELSFEWKIDSVIPGANGKTKAGDDYPIRIYVMFEYDPANATTWEKVQYNAIKLIYGRYPPLHTVAYVWANQNHSESYINSPYTDRVRIIFLDKGNAKAKTWQQHKRNILNDYKMLYNQNPPERYTVGIMTDSDNTKSSSKAYLKFLNIE